MQSEVNLHVFVVLDDGRILRAGRLLSRNLILARKGGYEGFFRYDPEYLASAGGYPLDPRHLPLYQEVFRAMRPERGIHGVFEDSLPGAWGERLLARKAGIHTGHYAPVHLLQALGGSGLGALLYSEAEPPPRTVEDASLDFDVLAPALDEAVRYEKTLDPMELRFLISGGYSAGGARPKLLLKKGGDHFIAKFSSIHDRSQSVNVRLEAAGLELGKRAGLKDRRGNKITFSPRLSKHVRVYKMAPRWRAENRIPASVVVDASAQVCPRCSFSFALNLPFDLGRRH